jgi:phospholipid transport system substrate-binding protein
MLTFWQKSTLLGCLMILVLLAGQGVSAVSPTEQVKSTVDQVIDVLRNSPAEGDARRAILSRLIRARFDFNIMSQRTLGPYWRQASAEEKKEFVQLYSDLLEASYIGRIEAYTNETVSYDSEQIEGNRAVVETVIHSGNTNIPIDYRMVQQKDGWFVYDVIVEDISLIRNYRSSYGEIVRREGFSGLFERMREKITEMHQASDAGAAAS